MELEAGDSGIRSLVSVQGSLAMFAIWRWGSEEQKERWLARMHTGDAIGCFGLTEPDAGSDPASMRTHARRDGGDWVLNGSKMWITNGTSRTLRSCGRAPTRGRSTASSSRRGRRGSRRPR
jgi:Acyl-CoA dehydrogenases